MPRRLELDVSYAAHRPWVPRRAQFESWVSAALRGADPGIRASAAAQLVISIRVIGAARSRRLNARYRRKHRPTNVLSFEGAGLCPDGRHFLGELVICAPVIALEAKMQRKSVLAHWAHITVHGVLHLLGYDHERTAQARKMASTEIQILDRLGFSNPYP